MLGSVSKGQTKTVAAIAKAHQGPGGAVGVMDAPYYTAAEILPYLTQEEKDGLQKEVLNTINNELVHPEDLEVAVPRLLNSCLTESKELRSAMNAIASSQIVEAQRALKIVKDSHARVQELKASFLKQGKLIQGMGDDTVAYKQLRRLHILRDNVLAVIEWSKALKEVRFENLYAYVEAHAFKAVYDRLKKLQRMRRTLISKAGAQYRSFQAVFEPYFSKLDVVLSVFVQEVFSVLEQDSMNISIQRALDDPDDPQPFPEFDMLRECIQVCSAEIEKPVLNYGSDGLEQEPPLTSDKIYDAVTKSVGKLWEEQVMVDVVDPFGQISVYLEQMKKVEPLLEALEMALIPLSSSFSFFGCVVEAIHEEVMRVVDGYVDPEAEVEANGLMEASDFVQWYKEMLTTCNFAHYVDISTIDDLSAQLMASAVGGLSDHLTRLCRACAITVCNDPKGPTVLQNGQPITTGPGDMFAVLQQMLSGLTTAIDMDVMRKIGKACAEAIYAYLDECRSRSDFDYWEDDNASASTPLAVEDWQRRRMQYLYAFCNDCATIETNLDTIELKFASCWSDDAGGEDGAEPATPFQKVQETLPDNSFYYLDEICAQVERIVGDQWALVFRAGPWYQDAENPVQLITNTMSDFIEEEFAVMLQEQKQRKLVRQMLVRFVQKYINTLAEFLADAVRNPKKNGVDSWGPFIDCISRDIEVVVPLWRTHATEGRGQLVELAQKAMELLKDLLNVKKAVDFNFVLEERMMDSFGDCPSFLIRFMLNARSKELDAATRERMLASWNEHIAYQQRDKDDRITTGWSQATSFFGAVDRTIADLERSAGMFRKSVKKKREEEQQQKVLDAKEVKREQRKAKREADTAASSRGKKRRPVAPTDKNVEVTSLADLLK
ncbi:hypothetical protein STCU_07184 [Strigomonas culicis]|uniref:Uncharacterized protein n=1 Tax=Strigomonas culicis TaxID=28005 RepID=S9VBN1_9TRYP|nr:hypothetical protein STCU_07184 [Strigomonas culicis]|eukprot:EPY24431.1 hypothetical protein STCU_07184 [Strigomonas culicis]